MNQLIEFVARIIHMTMFMLTAVIPRQAI